MKSIELYGDGVGKVEYISHVGSDLTVVNAARVSFGKHKTQIEEEDKKLIKYLIKHRHTSTLEHNVITFRFVVPLFVRSQHHRHRTWSYNEISRRYTDLNIKFYEPRTFRTQHKFNRQSSNLDDLIDPPILVTHPLMANEVSESASSVISKHNKECVKLYDKLIDAGVCLEQARGVLPQSLYTQYYGTCNLSNLLKFIDLRIHPGSQWEIQKVAKACLDIITELFPITVAAYRQNKKLD